MMITKPTLQYRSQFFFAAIPLKVSIPFGKLLKPLWDEVYYWLEDRKLSPSGAPLIRYLTTDMRKQLDIEVGFPVSMHIEGDARVNTGVLPAGKYATLVYTGPYDNEGLVVATASLLQWGIKNKVVWNTSQSNGIETWEARIENYLTDPAEETDSRKWRTEIAILTKSA
jgi:effector-binding domain-containing protein